MQGCQRCETFERDVLYMPKRSLTLFWQCVPLLVSPAFCCHCIDSKRQIQYRLPTTFTYSHTYGSFKSDKSMKQGRISYVMIIWITRCYHTAFPVNWHIRVVATEQERFIRLSLSGKLNDAGYCHVQKTDSDNSCGSGLFDNLMSKLHTRDAIFLPNARLEQIQGWSFLSFGTLRDERR